MHRMCCSIGKVVLLLFQNTANHMKLCCIQYVVPNFIALALKMKLLQLYRSCAVQSCHIAAMYKMLTYGRACYSTVIKCLEVSRNGDWASEMCRSRVMSIT